MNEDGRYDAESTLTIIPKRVYRGKHLLCQAVRPTSPSMRSLNDSMVLSISCEYSFLFTILKIPLLLSFP